MEHVQLALSRFKEGFSCSQAVLSAFSDIFGLDLNTALRISQSFGGGIAHRGEMCGAVSGALLVIGLKYGRTKAEDIQAREKTYQVVREFIKRFENLNESIICKDLLGQDLNTEEGLKFVEEEKLFKTLCPKFVQNATEILENLI
ncbi:MAG: C-GCAxxG-C-C family protein [Candidatus Aminicenantes bacterium]|nr:C-GCAxxG-C-C family protein [Candidatus Aminicenantes bacterium]MDH5383596.1 C-GCAxxG-C-C family protein [Candidatus Aminicenantes bacterium]MDH5742991.1 C-GCAxxG-C-C family protein [Candidatus Aminicenantes bacterium]